MTTTPNTPAPAYLSEALSEDASRVLRAAFNALPYSGMSGNVGPLRPGSYRDPLTVGDLLDGLDDMTRVLTDVSERANRQDREHTSLRRDVEGMRRLLGLAPAL